METKKRTHIVIPEELVKEIDRLTGKRKRSQFIAEAIKKEIQRLDYIMAVKDSSGAWKGKDHPELKAGAENWVRSLREKDWERMEGLK